MGATGSLPARAPGTGWQAASGTEKPILTSGNDLSILNHCINTRVGNVGQKNVGRGGVLGFGRVSGLVADRHVDLVLVRRVVRDDRTARARSSRPHRRYRRRWASGDRPERAAVGSQKISLRRLRRPGGSHWR